MEELENFVNRMDEEGVRIVHSRVTLPSARHESVHADFRRFASMRTRAYLVKDIDPEILRRLLGGHSRATDLDEEALNRIFRTKSARPQILKVCCASWRKVAVYIPI